MTDDCPACAHWQKAFEGQRKLTHLLQDRLDAAHNTILAHDRDTTRNAGFGHPPTSFHAHATQAIRIVHPLKRRAPLWTDRREKGTE